MKLPIIDLNKFNFNIEKIATWLTVFSIIGTLMAFCWHTSNDKETQRMDNEKEKTSIEIRLGAIEENYRTTSNDVKSIGADVNEMKGMIKVILNNKNK